MAADENLMLRKIMETGFCMLDLQLYLDTHPEDERALQVFNKISQLYNQQTEYFNENAFPLTANVAGRNGKWDWINGPFPPART